MKPGSLVRCIEPGFSGRVKLGQTYTVERVEIRQGRPGRPGMPGIFIDAVPGTFFWASRFELVSSAPVALVASAAPSPIHNLTEDQMRAIFTAPQAGHCKCGMLKAGCTYHAP